ncbi:GspH/FimT family pseudopilin [Ideonella sp. YS5]|uniref:GspH/FimT family pseudopilin n=1 Tax=Ideonella sp. YS5 TaxID=3453714 RepID=UPI003EEA91D6
MLTRTREGQRGFSLIELVIAITIVALLLLVAVPALQSWVSDARVRTAAESFQNAVRLAQAEAVKRSRTAVVMLTDSTPSIDAKPNKNGKRWVVRLLERSTTDDDEGSLFVRGGGEASSGDVTVGGDISLICFNALGQQTGLSGTANGLSVDCDKSDNTAVSFSRISGRTLKVLVNLGGKVRLCDAEKTFSESQPDGCPSTAS